MKLKPQPFVILVPGTKVREDNPSERSMFGYDRHGLSIYHGSIVRFYERGSSRRLVGHIWQGRDWQSDDESATTWIISFNHIYSETSIPAQYGYRFVVVGDVERNPDDERLLKETFYP